MTTTTPKVVRNFWIDGRVDGRAGDIGAGPKAKDGGFELTIYIRDNGKVAEGLKVYGREVNGTLMIEAVGRNGQRIEVLTNR